MSEARFRCKQGYVNNDLKINITTCSFITRSPAIS